MQYLMIIMILLSSACRLMEEPAQQVKGAYANGDIVFDAEHIGKAAVKQCQDTDCLSKKPVSYTLHQVALGNKEGVKVLQLSDLLVSFQTNKTYTCLAPLAPLGKLTLLWRNNRTELCYAQDKDKDYVRQLVVTCDKEADWQLAAKHDAAETKKFVCQQNQTEIPSACFVVGNSKACPTSNWPDSIKKIYAEVKGDDTGQPPPDGGGGITGETKLSEVKIMAEWKSPENIYCPSANKMTFPQLGDKASMEIRLLDNDDKTLSWLKNEKVFNDCSSATYPDLGADYYIPDGLCVDYLRSTSLADCGNDGSNAYIKITFEAKD